MYRLLERANDEGYRVFFLGATPAVLELALGRIRTGYPGVQIGGFHHGYFAPSEEPSLVSRIKASRSDILFIGFGTPKKELWVRRYLSAMGVPVVHGVGGSLDVLAGVIPRAPLWMQRSGLEWLFRVLQEPQRMWARYLVTNTVFLWLLAVELLRHWFRVAFRSGDGARGRLTSAHPAQRSGPPTPDNGEG
jgi:N-acetylglucosaminyldiphosphoundecaprenol N-acetyl-beta-D-mannosaminyltransferase